MINGLTFFGEDDWHPIPNWARFFVELGSRLASFNDVHPYPVVAAALPTRAYAAAFAAMGVVLGRLATSHAADATRHFQCLAQIAEQPGGAPVTVREGHNRQVFGQLRRVRVEAGVPYLEVLLSDKRNGSLKKLVPPWRALTVQLSSQFTPPGRATRLVREHHEFVRRVLQQVDPTGTISLDDFAGRTSIECVILGVRSHLQSEILDTRLGSGRPTGPQHEGRIQDLLRTRELLPRAIPCRAQILSSSGELCSSQAVSSVAIFDGSRTFLRERDNWRGRPWLVLLDRTEPSFEDAVAAVHQEYVDRRPDEINVGISSSDVPVGVEITSFAVSH